MESSLLFSNAGTFNSIFPCHICLFGTKERYPTCSAESAKGSCACYFRCVAFLSCQSPTHLNTGLITSVPGRGPCEGARGGRAPNHSECVSGRAGANWLMSSVQLARTCPGGPTSPGQTQIPALNLGMRWGRGEEVASRPSYQDAFLVFVSQMLSETD